MGRVFGRCGCAVAVALVLASLGFAARAAVRLELRVPPAETYVLGDVIPLFWRFENEGPQPLGFMWEGCCRLNGKLEVLQAGNALPTVPPGQALAHMFARADRLDPGVPKEYETQVADWVALPGTGTYDLLGTYRGVLPTQFPQVQRGLALWRDAAVSDGVRVSVLAVDSYLATRDARSRTRGLRLTLSGPDRLPPLGRVPFRVAFENLRDEPRTLNWPDDVALWVLDEHHRRRAAAAVIGGSTAPLTVPARGRVESEFVLEADRFEGEALGDYRLFVDLAAAGPGQPRVPTPTIPLAWRLTPEQVADLVEQAARGTATGARNAPLKLLRVYLSELAEPLASLASRGLSVDATRLADRLSRAAGLKPIAPRPGAVEVILAVPASGTPTWAQPEVRRAVRGDASAVDLASQVGELLGLRRHLGWEVTLVFAPAEGASVGRIHDLAGALEPFRAELAGPIGILLPTGGTNAPARVLIAPDPASAGGEPTLRVGAGEREWAADGVGFRGVETDAALSELAAESASARGGEIRLRAGASVGWGRLESALAPLRRPGARFVLAVDPAP